MALDMRTKKYNKRNSKKYRGNKSMGKDIEEMETIHSESFFKQDN